MAKLTVFVACPYTLFPLDDYKAVFSAVKRTYDIDFKFADEQITNQYILSKITNYTRESDISIYDVTGWNANVALDLGIAVGLNRRYFILLNTKIDVNKDVPSDIKGIDRIQYASNQELEAKLIFLIKQEIKTSNKSDSAFESVKRRVSDVLTAKPGQKLAELSEVISEDKTLVQSVVRAMVINGELTTKGQKKGMSYYIADTDLGAGARNT